jgi:hypothetical protein
MFTITLNEQRHAEQVIANLERSDAFGDRGDVRSGLDQMRDLGGLTFPEYVYARFVTLREYVIDSYVSNAQRDAETRPARSSVCICYVDGEGNKSWSWSCPVHGMND